MPYTFALSGHRKPSVGAVSSSASSGVMVCVAIVRRSSVRDERRGPLPSSRVRGRARGDREPSTAAPRARDALRAREEASTRRRSILSGRLRASALVVTAKKSWREKRAEAWHLAVGRFVRPASSPEMPRCDWRRRVEPRESVCERERARGVTSRSRGVPTPRARRTTSEER